jgi:hypothetical protein
MRASMHACVVSQPRVRRSVGGLCLLAPVMPFLGLVVCAHVLACRQHYQEDWWLQALLDNDLYHGVWHRQFFSHSACGVRCPRALAFLQPSPPSLVMHSTLLAHGFSLHPLLRAGSPQDPLHLKPPPTSTHSVCPPPPTSNPRIHSPLVPPPHVCPHLWHRL